MKVNRWNELSKQGQNWKGLKNTTDLIKDYQMKRHGAIRDTTKKWIEKSYCLPGPASIYKTIG